MKRRREPPARNVGQGVGMGTAFMLVGALLAIGPIFLQGFLHSPITCFVISGIGVAIFITGGIFSAYSSLFRKASADQAFVMTGRGGSKVVLDGGDFVIPMFHKIT